MDVQVTGFEELKRKITALGNDKDKRREMLLILRQVAQPTLNAARQTVPISGRPHNGRRRILQPGNLRKSLGVINGRKGAAAINPTVYVGPRAKGSFDGYYGHFVHEGVNRYATGFKRKRKRGANMASAVSRSQGNPFMEKAYSQTQGTVTSDAEKKMAQFIQRRIDKLSRT